MNLLFTGAGSRDGSMGLWEISDEVLTQAEKCQNVEGVPGYSHISHSALKDIPKEYTHPYNCKVRALAFNNSHKVSRCPWLMWLKIDCFVRYSSSPFLCFYLIHPLGVGCCFFRWIFPSVEGRRQPEQGTIATISIFSLMFCQAQYLYIVNIV